MHRNITAYHRLFSNSSSPNMGDLSYKSGMCISHILAREIFDCRGNPTVEVDVLLESGALGRASVPSGASTGKCEAVERRDGMHTTSLSSCASTISGLAAQDSARFLGRGVTKVVQSIEHDIAPRLKGYRADQQRQIDTFLCELDGTHNKAHLGANATLGVSLACARAAAAAHGLPLYQYLGGVGAHTLPMPLINVINGGVHANNGLCIQEFMIVPIGTSSMMDALHYGFLVFNALKKILSKRGLSVAVGDEGGVAPPLKGTTEALDLLMEAIHDAKLVPGEDVAIALDVAASEFFDEEKGAYAFEGDVYSGESLIKEIYVPLVEEYPICSIEDPLDQEDFQSWKMMTHLLGDRLQIVGDDIFVTHPDRLQQGVDMHAANAILIKLNQIGTLTETLDVIDLAHKSGYHAIISHRSGETEDTFISDLAVATNSGQIKTGSLCRSERTAKYNQLLRIQEQLGANATFASDLFTSSY